MVMLGKKQYLHDPRTLMFEDYVLRHLLPAIPDTCDKGSQLSYGMLANDRLGDCTAAGVAHATQSLAWDGHHSVVTPTDDETIKFYELFGYNPNDPSTDQGAIELHVLRKWSKLGFVTGGVDHKIAAYTLANTKNVGLQKAGLYLFGGLYSGVALPVAAQSMGNHWKLPSDLNDPNAYPGSWGGHCVWAVAYNEQALMVVSWGEIITVDWSFVTTYFDEQWVILSSQDYLNGGKSPEGFNWQQLKADLALV